MYTHIQTLLRDKGKNEQEKIKIDIQIQILISFSRPENTTALYK